MAAALDTDTMLDSPTADAFERHSPRHLVLPPHTGNLSPNDSPVSSPLPSPRGHPPPPNPHFVFPARPSSASAPSSYSRATGRRPQSAIDLKERAFGVPADTDARKPRSPILPDFSFNPGAALSPSPESAFLSPPLSPQSPRSIPARPTGHGHRRGGSEFVGGNIRAGDTITVMSTSPTKSESGFASPRLAPVEHSERTERKGHGHRRSTAISSHDLSKILQPTSPNPVRGSSAPTSPSSLESTDQYSFPDVALRSDASTMTSSLSKMERSDDKTPEISHASQENTEELQPKPVPRAKVGFSDTLEFIPRPLSLVSSDTSSTATARPGHSVSGSISSVISMTNSTATDRENMSPIGPSPPRNRGESRPSTAGAILERTQSIHEPDNMGASSPKRRNSIPVLASLPTFNPIISDSSTPSPSKAPKRWSFFGIEPFAGSNSPTRSRPVSACSSESPSNSKAATSSSAQHSPQVPSEEIIQDEAGDQKPVPRKRSKKQKKVKTWSILTRKSKQRHVKHRAGSRRAPTPPLRRPSEVDDGDEDASVPTAGPVMPTVLVTETSDLTGDAQSWRPPRRVSVPDEDVSSPVIDLDAALGPFNTPLPHDPAWEEAQRAGGLAKRPLHSAAGMSRFTGPGMHYHRRAESAPEMVPFEGGRFGIQRFGSSSTMADVFEEDEEDEANAEENKKASSSAPQVDSTSERETNTASAEESSLSIGEKALNEERVTTHPHGVKRKGSGLSDDEGSQARLIVKTEHSTSSLQDDVIMEEPNDLSISGLDGGCGINIAAESSASSTPSPRQIFKGKDLSPVEISPLHLPTASLVPISPYSMTHSSAFPSPRSPMSYDANRVSTAPSSITEDNFQSLLMGEPGPEVRISVDDIPSLTSSNSTMTRESTTAHQARPHPSPFHEQQRPASLTSAAFGRRRSSLASLSRLISSSHGERSKLSIEMSLDSEAEKKPKVSKAKRLSRMMQFWKSKENAAT